MRPPRRSDDPAPCHRLIGDIATPESAGPGPVQEGEKHGRQSWHDDPPSSCRVAVGYGVGSFLTPQVALLDSWNFTAEHWARWPGPLHEVNPAPEIWAAYDTIGR